VIRFFYGKQQSTGEKENPKRKPKGWHLKVLFKNSMEKAELHFLCSSKGKFRRRSEREQCRPSITAASNLQRFLTSSCLISQFCNCHPSPLPAPPATDRMPPQPYELYISFPCTNTRTRWPLPQWGLWGVTQGPFPQAHTNVGEGVQATRAHWCMLWVVTFHSQSTVLFIEQTSAG
jgi:hypothetical protein